VVSPSELAAVCDDVLAAYVKGDLRGATGPNGESPPPLTGLRRRRPALISLESGDSTPEPVLDAGSVDLGPESPGQPSLALIDFCGLEDFVVLQQPDGVELVFLWVSEYPVTAASPGLDIAPVDFSDDVGALNLPPTSRVVPPSNSFEPGKVAEECLFAVQAALGEDWASHAVSSRVVLCTFETLLSTRADVIAGKLI